MIKARKGQGKYRKGVLNLWGNSCTVTSVTNQLVLIASHIKPWAESNNAERLDPSNGLTLIATLDNLFDQYLITFNPDNGKMFISDAVDEQDHVVIGIPSPLKIKPSAKQTKYLRFHFNKFRSN